MGFLGDWFNKKAISNTVGVSQPVKMEVRFVGMNQVVWSVVDGAGFIDNGYLGNHAVFSVQDWKSQKCATADPIVSEKVDEKTYRKFKSLMKEPTRDSFLRAQDIKHKALREISDHEMKKVLDHPNPYMSRYELDYGLSAYLDLTGNGYLFGVRDGMDGVTGKIKEIYLPAAQNVQATMSNYEIINYFLLTNPEVKINAANVCHLRNWNPLARTDADRYSGLSRLHALSHIIDSYNESIEAEASIYQDKGVRTILFPKGVVDPNELSTEQGMSQRDRFNQQVKEVGVGGILTSKIEMGSINLGFSPAEMGILESKKLSKIDICAAYHVPPEIMFWGENSTYNNMPAFRKIALTDAVLPEYEKKADKLNDWLTPSYDPDGKQGLVISYNYDDFNELQPDKKELADWLSKVPLTANEIREAFGYGIAKDENADKVILSGNFKLLETMDMESFAGSGVNPFDSGDNTDSNA